MVPTVFSVTVVAAEATLLPVNLVLDPKAPPLMLSGTVSTSGYTLQLEGAATAKQMISLRASAGPLMDGIEGVVPGAFDTVTVKASAIAVRCTRLWRGAQTCAAVAVEPVKKTGQRR